jgi:glycine C-acetyltransferase
MLIVTPLTLFLPLLQSIQSAGTFKNERIITTPQSASIGVTSTTKKVLNFCANNYLGLANNKELLDAAKKTLDTHGFGMASVRFICGTQDIHKELEAKIAKFHGMEGESRVPRSSELLSRSCLIRPADVPCFTASIVDAILFPSCFDANAGFFEAIFGPEDAVISDALNHASIIDGIRLCKSKRMRYAHMDMKDLEKQLQESQSSRFRVIVTDGVFSMDGHIAPLKEICDLADKYNAYVFIDECHSTGFFGKTGRGTPEYCGVEGRIDFINSTLGKALGGATGGYTAASKEIVALLRQRARPYLFSNAVAPNVAGASIACFDMLSRSTALRDKLESNTKRFRSAMEKEGFDLGGSKDHPIIPIMLGDAKLAGRFAEEMLLRGIYVVGFSFPVVPKGAARIRTQISAAHSEEDIDRAIQAFVEVKKMLMK